MRNMTKGRGWRMLPVVALVAGALALTGCGSAGTPEAGGLPTAAPDDLVEKAKAEGSLMMYADATEGTLKSWTAAFTAQYGIPVTIVRNATAPLYQQFAQEQAAGQAQADLLSLLDLVSLNEAVDSGWIAEYHPAGADAFPAEYSKPGLFTAVQSVTSPAIMYNKNKVTPAEVARMKADPMGFLADPSIKGRLGVVAPQAGQMIQAIWWLYSDGKAASEIGGWTGMGEIAANTAKISDTVTVAQNVTQGEIDFGFPIADSLVSSQIAATGAPIAFVYPDPTVAVADATGVVATAPHPYAARLFMEWATSPEGNTAWAKYGQTAPLHPDSTDARAFVNSDWYVPRSDGTWTDFSTDPAFLKAMAPDGSYFPKWNQTFGYRG